MIKNFALTVSLVFLAVAPVVKAFQDPAYIRLASIVSPVAMESLRRLRQPSNRSLEPEENNNKLNG